MIDLILYQNNGESNRVDKIPYLLNKLELSGVLKSSTSILNPNISIEFSSDDIFKYNYAYIPSFNRYYFIVDITVISTNRVSIDFRVDVLMTYYPKLLNADALVSRNEHRSTEGYIGNGNALVSSDKYLPISGLYTYSSIGEKHKIFEPVNSNYAYFVLTCFSSGNIDELSSTFPNPYKMYCHTYLIKSNYYSSGHAPSEPNLFKYIFDLISSDNEKYGSYVASIYALPFDGSSFSSISTSRIKIGTQDSWIAVDNSLNSRFGDQGVYTLELNEYLLTFPLTILNSYDLSPFTEYQLHLPLYGTLPIPEELLMGTTDNNTTSIEVRYVLDFTIGSLTYKVGAKYGDDYIEFFNQSISMLCEIPKNSSNAEAIARQKDVLTANYIGNSISSLAGSLAGLVAGAALAPVTGGMSLVGGLAATAGSIASVGTNYYKMNAEKNALKPQGYVVNSSSNYGKYDITNKKLCVNDYIYIFKKVRKDFTEMGAIDATAYDKLIGKPCLISAKIRDLKGYTEISNIHIEIQGILSSESEELLSLLNSGVLFPDMT